MTTIYDPTAQPGVPIMEYDLAIDPRRSGLVIGLVSNGFPDATNLLTAVGRALSACMDAPVVRMFERFDASVVVSDEVLADVGSQCDAVVTAMGHCGSCTSSTVRDATLVARRGVPVVALVSTKFTDLAQFVARSVGIPDIPRVWLPHPISGQGLEYIDQVAQSIAPTVVQGLAGIR